MQPLTDYPILSSLSADSHQNCVSHADDLILNLAKNALNFQIPGLLNVFIPLQQPLQQVFGTYSYACQTVDQLLLSLNQVDAIARACQESKIGKKLPTALYVHVSAVSQLSPLLRLADQWGRSFLPENYQTTLVKFHTNQLLISYLAYPDFDRDAHPILESSIQVNLPNGSVRKK
jgi:DNA phosphorothioation-associated putative methyltransferase